MESTFVTVSSLGRDEFVEKRSRFIGHCKPVSSEEEALRFINSIKKEYWDARHNVYAYCLRQGQIKRYSDDGEPQGSAGVPTLDVLLKNNVSDAAVVITRYFGGILLGTGGLARAYSRGAKIALDAAHIVTMELCADCTVSCDYNRYGKLNTLISNQGGCVDNSDFSDSVTLSFHIPVALLPSLNKAFADATAGEIQPCKTGEKYYQRS